MIYKLLLIGLPAAMVLLLLHHRYIHNGDVQLGWQRWFQWDDVNNHETVILLLLGILIGLLITKYVV